MGHLILMLYLVSHLSSLESHLSSLEQIVITPNFSSSSELVKFFIMTLQVTPSVSYFSECLELFSDFRHISVGPSDVIPLAVSDVCPKPIYLFILFLGVLPNEFVTLHLPEMHDETYKQITICNDDFKFAVYPHSILQNFAVKIW